MSALTVTLLFILLKLLGEFQRGFSFMRVAVCRLCIFHNKVKVTDSVCVDPSVAQPQKEACCCCFVVGLEVVVNLSGITAHIMTRKLCLLSCFGVLALDHRYFNPTDGFVYKLSNQYRSLPVSRLAAQNEEDSLKADAQMLEQRLRTLVDNQPSDVNYSPSCSQPSVADIEAILQRPTINVSSTSEDNEDDGVFLDADMYTQAQEFLESDGSLRLTSDGKRAQVTNNILESFSSPSLPSPSSPRQQPKGKTSTVGDLMEAMRQQQQKLQKNITSDDLHQQVMDDEVGFQKQSQVFRESLVDATKAFVASEIRNGEAFRQRQSRAQENLSRELEAFEANLLQNTERKVKNPCARCGCELGENELRQAPSSDGVICQICLGEEIYEKSKQAGRIGQPGLESSAQYSSQSQLPYARRQTRQSSPTRVQNSLPQTHSRPTRSPMQQNSAKSSPSRLSRDASRKVQNSQIPRKPTRSPNRDWTPFDD